MPLIHCATIQDMSWQPQAAAQYSVTGGVHVWRLQLSVHATGKDALYPQLSTDERDRAERYHNEKDRLRFVVSRAVLRLLLGQYMRTDARTVVLGSGANKKPYVQTADHTLHYNMAHAGDWALIAISAMPVGVDTEAVNSELDVADIIAATMSEVEQPFAQGSRRSFYQCWTRKEALLKATGKGIDDDLPQVPCMDGNHEAAAAITGADSDWNVMSFEVDSNNTGCVAYVPLMTAPQFYTVQHIRAYA